MVWGNKPTDGGNLILNSEERQLIINENSNLKSFIKICGSQEFIKIEGGVMDSR